MKHKTKMTKGEMSYYKNKQNGQLTPNQTKMQLYGTIHVPRKHNGRKETE